jgi:hypothetical protein
LALNTFVASTDFAGKGRTLSAYALSQGTGAQTINFRDGGASGAIKWQVQLPATSSKEFTFAARPVWFNSLYVEVVGTGFTTGSVDIS